MPADRGRMSMRLTFLYLLLLLATATTACSGTVTVPDQTSSLAPLTEVANDVTSQRRVDGSFDLVSGSFSMTTVDGDISGDYTGHGSVSSSGRTTASLDLRVTNGTNAFQGATGSLTGDGTGAFAGEGSFSISFKGSVSTAADPGGLRVRGTVDGTSFASCLAQGISVTLQGDGSFGKLGDVQAVLTHLAVSNGGCSP
jgi:hypothetical protein